MSDAVEAALEVHTTGMLALIPSVESAENLLVDGGDSPDQLHVTLVYLGEAAEIDAQQRAVIIQNVREASVNSAFEGNIFGRAEFNPGEDAAQVYMVGGTPIQTLRDELKIHDKSEYAPYVAHLTAGYGVPLDSLTYTGPVTFDRIRVAFGDEVTDVHLMKEEDMSKQAELTVGRWDTSHADGFDTYTYMQGNYIAVSGMEEDDPELGGPRYYWDVSNVDDWAVVASGTAGTQEEALQAAESILHGYVNQSFTSSKTATTKTAWTLNAESGQYVAEGSKPDFSCDVCNTKVALVDDMNICSNCGTGWHSWSVQSTNKTAAPMKHFVRSVMKRDNVVLAANRAMVEASSNSWGDSDEPTVNDVKISADNYYLIDGELVQCDASENVSEESAYASFERSDGSSFKLLCDDLVRLNVEYADDDAHDEFHFTSGYLLAEKRLPLPDSFTETFREGYIESLNVQLAALK